MGSFDGVETCELVGCYLLSLLTKTYGHNIAYTGMMDWQPSTLNHKKWKGSRKAYVKSSVTTT